MATYINNLRLKEITTGDEDGTWGTSTNTNLELIADGFSYGTKEMAADANETFTMPDATADATRSLYLKFTSAVSLTATREITLGPNTVSKTWIIENATTGSQIITIKQGSGATVNVANGSKVMVVTDGAGAGAAVFNANPTEAGGTVTSVGGTGTVNGLTLTGTVTSSGNLTLGGTLANVDLTSQVTGTLPIANGGTGSTSTTYVDLTTNVTGTLPVANGGTNLTTLGTANQVLAVNSGGTALEYQSAAVGSVTSVDVSGGTTGLTTSGGPITSSGTVTIAGTLGEENGGTGQTGYTTGDLLYASGTDTLAKLALGSADQALKVNSGGTQLEWVDAGGGVDFQEFTSSGTWTKPAGANYVKVEVWSAGGGGEGGRTDPGPLSPGGEGGGGGGYFTRFFKASDLGSTEPVVIGAGGAGGVKVGNTGNNAGTPGGNSNFGTWISTYGGGGGSSNTPTWPFGNRGGLAWGDEITGRYYPSTVEDAWNAAKIAGDIPGPVGTYTTRIGIFQSAEVLQSGTASNVGQWGYLAGGPGGYKRSPGSNQVANGSGSVYGGAGGGGGGMGDGAGPIGNMEGGDGGTNTLAKGGGAFGGSYPTSSPTRNGAPGGQIQWGGGGGGGATDTGPGTVNAGNGGTGGYAGGGGGGGGGRPGTSTPTVGSGASGGPGLIRVTTW